CQQDLMLSKTYIFPQLTDNARPLAYPRATFARICRDANIDNLRMHDLRRTFATRILQATGDIAIASHLLNHHSLTATRRYAFHNAATSHAVVSQVIESYDTKK
ncbi:tyrosine-type recombinase/integrase, partial [Escherichia coli]